jgi:hypothetical protein
MKTANRSTKYFAMAIALVAGAVWAGLPATRVGATAEVNEFPSPLCITRGQTLQLNVANYEGPDTSPILVEMAILDQDGKPLTRSKEMVSLGHTAVLRLNGNEIGSRTEFRILTRAVVRSIGDPNLSHLVISEEVVDNETQKTLLLHPGISRGFDPQPDPPGSN